MWQMATKRTKSHWTSDFIFYRLIFILDMPVLSKIRNIKITSKINLDNSKMPLATTFKKSSYILWTMEFPQRQFSINAFWTILMAPLGTLNIPKADRFELMYTDSVLGWNAVHLQVHFKSLFENYIRKI